MCMAGGFSLIVFTVISGVKSFLATPIEYLKGVGTMRGELLRKELGIHTFEDLLNFFPYRYVDKSRFTALKDVSGQEKAVLLKGTISSPKLVGQGRSKRLTAVFTDGTARAELVWFKGIKWIQNLIAKPSEWTVYGKPSMFNGRVSLAHPELNQGLEKQTAFSPVYSTTEKLKSRKIDSKTVEGLVKTLLKHPNLDIPEFLPGEVLEKHQLLPLEEAMRKIHFPNSEADSHKARFRFKYQELFFIQIKLAHRKQSRDSTVKGPIFQSAGDMFKHFYEDLLPFELTDAQKKVFREIYSDCRTGSQMNRLLQGDVGSGKSIIAFMSLLLGVSNGFQGTVMAPTEILAMQLFEQFKVFGDQLDIRVALLTGSTTAKVREEVHEGLRNGGVQILVGTHALIEDEVEVPNQGIVIIDEQHRFGVAQRARLWNKGRNVSHVLVMTATPIPRTLAMTLYGDLDVSVIDELPQGRKPIKTVHRTEANRLRVWGFLKEEISKGRQIYIVYPLIEESSKLDFKNLTDGFDSLIQVFPRPHYQLDILHGRMKPADKEFIMERFRKGETQILVSTTVIEVGINVPNASVMLIESAERFGLSQLHQLRGRVGRGGDQSYCILMTNTDITETAKKRMSAMVSTTDGFRLAELDMELRGPGEMDGTRQSGLPEFKVADLTTDQAILGMAREMAIQLIQSDPELVTQSNAKLKEYMSQHGFLTHWGKVS